MLNTMKYYIFLFAFILSASSALLAQKSVHLVHGLAGSTASWSALNTRINTLCPSVPTTNGTYTSNEGIAAFSTSLATALTASGASNEDIAIGHSMGGLALRSLDAAGANLYGGYITVASPHGGARLANSIIDGSMENYINSGCKEVVDGPVQSVTTSLILGVPFPILQSTSGVVKLLTYLVCDNLFSIALAAEGWMGSPFTGTAGLSTIDLAVGGAAAALPPSSLPSITITGQINADSGPHIPVHWATLSDVSDKDIAADVRDVSNRLKSSRNIVVGIAGALPVYWLVPSTWVNKIFKTRLYDLADELDDGIDWLDRSEDGWVSMIGAAASGGTVVMVPHEVPLYQPCNGPGECSPDDVCIKNQCVPKGTKPCEVEYNMTTTILIPTFVPNTDLHNDGIVPVPSQVLPGSIRQEGVDGVSHFAETRSRDVWRAINRQTDSEISDEDVFWLEGCSF